MKYFLSLENKVLAYLINQDFVKDRDGEERFANTITRYSKSDVIYRIDQSRYGYPVLESICQLMSQQPDCDLLSIINEILEKKDMRGYMKTVDDLQFSPFCVNGPFTSKSL